VADLAPVSWAYLVKRLRQLGFDGPFRGGKHPYMLRGDLVLTVPNPHRGNISVALLSRILKQAGISRQDFHRYYRPVCDAVAGDNRFGTVVFTITNLIKRSPFLRRAVMRMADGEQAGFTTPGMSGVLWDTFTGNASHRDVFFRTLHPVFLARLLHEIATGWLSPVKSF